ncbi:DMBT1 [Branchiostoma lanceolatum]|uniref:DMBT1 protein n=1 Tax=Branchiostoma lanceolatum TaxID=7740 RepID=A0A8J9VAL4_BRALA|nr:DMBT1 [Branchiostoma lanceolatum]
MEHISVFSADGAVDAVSGVQLESNYTSKRNATYLAPYKGWHYYKVPVNGAMTSKNVKDACESAGFVTPCPGGSACEFSSSSCVTTGLVGCSNPMSDVSQELCGDSPDLCAQLHGVYQFMNNWSNGGACGAEPGSWCANWSGHQNKYAFCARDPNVTTVARLYTIATPHDATVAHDKDSRNCCGNIMRQASGVVDQSGGYRVPDGWTMCYIDGRDTAYHNTPCRDLLQGIPEYGDARQLLSAGGNFGCWHGDTGGSPGPALATNSVIPKSCRDGIQQGTRLSSWGSRRTTTTLGVCIKGIACDQNAAAAASLDTTAAPHDTTAAPSKGANQNVAAAASLDTTAVPHDTTAAPSKGAKRNASYLALYKGWHYYKVPVTGAMTSANVKATCEAAGYVTPCSGDNDCRHSSPSCVFTGLEDCFRPMNDVSQALCGATPHNCAQLDGVYQFMSNWTSDGDACGAESGRWCVEGSAQQDRYAFCARGNCCGNILRQATDEVDHSTTNSVPVPDGWTMCYIDGRDAAYHNTSCRDLLQGIPKYGDADQLLAAGGNFGCWHGNTGDSPGPAFATNNVIQKSCRDDIQHGTRLSSWNPLTSTLGVCIKGINCDKRTTAPSDKISASIKCTNDYMELSIPEDELTDITLNDLHWEPDQNCGATTNGTHYVFRTDLYGCGTKVTFDPKYVIFKNNINIRGTPSTNSVIARDGGIRITSKCKYERQQWVDSTFLPIPGGHGLNFTEEGFGQLEVRLSMFPTEQYQTPYKADQYPVHLKLRQHIYMQLEAHGHDKKLSVRAVNCKATISPEPNDTLQYQLINDGCASDPTLDIYNFDNPAKERFGFEAFRFIQEVKTVYVHCEVMVCNATDPGSRCAKGCIARRKRTTGEKVNMVGRHMIRLGPIILDDDEEVGNLRHRGAPWAMVVAGGGLMALALAVMGAAIVLKRSRREEWAYRRLTDVVEEVE